MCLRGRDDKGCVGLAMNMDQRISWYPTKILTRGKSPPIVVVIVAFDSNLNRSLLEHWTAFNSSRKPGSLHPFLCGLRDFLGRLFKSSLT
jgi:hypothetical protein